MFSWHKIRILSQMIYLDCEIFQLKYITKTTASGEMLNWNIALLRVSCTPDEYKIRNFSQMILLVHEIFDIRNFLQNLCIRNAPQELCRTTSLSITFNTKSEIAARSSFRIRSYSILKIFSKTSVLEVTLCSRICRATSSSIMFSWYETRNFSQIFLLVHQTFDPRNFSQDLCIRSNAQRPGIVVPPLRVSCTPDTKPEISATYSSWLTRHSILEIFRKISVSGVTLSGRHCRATSSSIMFSWYKIWNFSQILLQVNDTFDPRNFS